MRFLSVVLLFTLALGLTSGVALGDKGIKTAEPNWHYDLRDARATYPEQEPNNTCPGQSVTCGDVVDPAYIDTAGDVDWYTFSISAIVPITVGTDAGTNCTGAGDTYIYLYDTDCTTILAQDDDSGPGFYSLISNYNPTHAGVFNVKVRHYSTSGTGCYKLFVTCAPPATGACCVAGGACQIMTQAACGTAGGAYQGDNTSCSPNPCPQPPPNDTCAGAIDIADCTSGHLEGNTSAATNDYALGSPSCTGFSTAGKDVVYRLTMNAGDVVHLVYTQLQADGAFYIVSDCSNPTGTCLVGADQTVTGQAETIDYTFTAGGIYYLILDAYTSNGGGPWTLDYVFTCPPPPEACCFIDGHCEMHPPDACRQIGGAPQGTGTTCDPNPCPPPPPEPQACCFPDGHCEMLLVPACVQVGGTPQGQGSVCDTITCPQPPVACCFPDGHCEFVTAEVCAQLGGMPQGYGSLCNPNPCPQPPMACCFPDGHCEYVTADRCVAEGGSPQGYGTVCDPNPCSQPPPTGACCIGDQGDCEIMTADQCAQAGGQYQGNGVLCQDPNPCPIVPVRKSTWGKVKGTYR